MKESTVWIWGRHPVLEAVRAGSARLVLIASARKPSDTIAEIQRLAAGRGIPIREVPLQQVERIAPGQHTQGVAAQVTERKVRDLDELLQITRRSQSPPFLLALDQIQDPQNLGSLLRTADAAGVHGVILPERRSAPVSGIVAKASAGAVSHLPLLEVTNLARTLEALQRAGIWVLGLDSSGRQDIYSVDLTPPLALIVGSEGTGLRRLTRQRCDLVIRLPMHGRIESLNAAVAGAIAMYEVVRQRSS